MLRCFAYEKTFWRDESHIVSLQWRLMMRWPKYHFILISRCQTLQISGKQMSRNVDDDRIIRSSQKFVNLTKLGPRPPCRRIRCFCGCFTPNSSVRGLHSLTCFDIRIISESSITCATSCENFRWMKSNSFCLNSGNVSFLHALWHLW